ncbi:MAG: CvpA family protein [Sedimentisphaerales bacterium]|nr:CvpA family protein [Sedimentisphaerales bacterium]
MANLGVLVIIAGCAAYLYLKGSFVKSFAILISTILATVVAFSYFELLANVFINRDTLVNWAQPISFIALFVVAMVVLLAICLSLSRQSIELGYLPERIGRIACGILIGFMVSGCLLTALSMAPLSGKWPYPRFASSNPDVDNPTKLLFNADGFVTGWYNMISGGSFSGKRSFAAVHPDFLDQSFLNRYTYPDGVPLITSSGAIEVPEKMAFWPAPEGLRDSNGKAIPTKQGHNLTIVRVGLTSKVMKPSGKFSFSQLRLVCKQKGGAEDVLAGKGTNAFPVGYLKTADQLQLKKLDETIQLEQADLGSTTKWIDFAFYVPSDSVPVLVEFKQNNVVQVPQSKPGEEIPPAVSFVPLSVCAKGSVEVLPDSSARLYGVELGTTNKFLSGLTLEISDVNQWQKSQTDRSIKLAQFEEDNITYVRAELKVAKPEEEEGEQKKKKWDELKAFSKMLKPLDGYRLISLKCNNPSTGAAISAEQLPVLVDSFGLIHRPVGVVATGDVNGEVVHEVDYCRVVAKEGVEGLTIAEDETIEQAFPDSVWLTEQAQSISEFYVLYLVKSGKDTIILSVQPADSERGAGFNGAEGFFIK